MKNVHGDEPKIEVTPQTLFLFFTSLFILYVFIMMYLGKHL
jgi:hypothetical protein